MSLSYFFMCFLLCLSFPLVGFFFLHTIPATGTSYCFLFLFIVLLHISFHTYFLYKMIWAFVGQIMLTGSKGSWAQFVLICQSHSVGELYSTTDLLSIANLHFAVDRFPLHFFLWTFLALRSSWWVYGPYFSLGFPPYELLGTDSKNGH